MNTEKLINALKAIAKEQGLAKQHFAMASSLSRTLAEDGYNPRSRKVLKEYPEQRSIEIQQDRLATVREFKYSLENLIDKQKDKQNG